MPMMARKGFGPPGKVTVGKRFRGRGGGIALVSTLLCLASGCGREEAPPQPPAADPSPSVVEVAGSRPAAVGEVAPLIYIDPKTPRVDDDLYARVHGSGTVGGYVWTRNGFALQEANAEVLPKRSFLRGDEITVTVSVNGKSYQATTVVANTPPKVLAVSFVDPQVHAGADIAVVPEGVDADGDPIEYHYTWSINGEAIPGLDAPVLPGDRVRKGDRIGLQVVPGDGTEDGNPVQGEEFVVPDAPPRFVSVPPLDFKGSVYRYEARAADPDGDPLVYSLESAPTGMRIDPGTGRLEWNVGKEQTGEHVIRISVQDDEGMRAVQEYTLKISITE